LHLSIENLSPAGVGAYPAVPVNPTMNIPYLKQIRQHAPAISVLVVCSVLTVMAYLSDQSHTQERISLHASADATQFQRTLQQGVDSYLHLNRGLAAYFTAVDLPRAQAFNTYTKTADVLREHPGLSYIGYVQRIERAQHARFAHAAKVNDPELNLRPAKGLDPDYFYPYLYAFPLDSRSRAAKGLDFSAVPERWTAMQLARDSGRSAATAKHFYLTGPTRVPIVVVFTPIYDPDMPSETVAQRRVALRGFVFSMYHPEEVIERMMGSNFRALFDLEIYDSAVRAENILYDGDKRPHVLMRDADMPIARQSNVMVAGREWKLYFFPKPTYAERYRTWSGLAILLLGLSISCALSFAMWSWTRRLRARAGQRSGELQFDEVFADHASAVYSLDPQRRFLNANAVALKELKLSKGALIGTPVERLIVPEKQALAKERFEHALRGNSVSYDSTIIDADGVRTEMSIIMIPVKAGGRVISVLGIGQNITARKASERRLQESREMLQLVIDHIPQRVFWKDTNFTFLGGNEAFCRDAGLNGPNELVGRTDFDMGWRASAELYRQDDIETLRSGVAKINYEERQERDDGSASWLRTSKIPLTDMHGNTLAVLGMYEDITERKNMEEKLREMAHHDVLTGLVNRAFFHHQLTQAVAKCRRDDSLLALMYFDIDHFKSINDSFGHDAGDALLKAFAQRVSDTVREMDVFARLGGDEFALLLENVLSHSAAETVAGKLVKAMQAPFQLGDRAVTVSTSIGIAYYQPGMPAADLIKRADQAMYRAKHGGRNRFEVDRTPGAATP
jgi:diguanylate cyclase (GGDEF)-like protein/PAS domain S-box-containing protein